MNGAERIAAERQRQIEAEGYTLQHDVDEHGTDGALIAAARSYCLHAWWKVSGPLCGWTPSMVLDIVMGPEEGGDAFDLIAWPWEESDWKPSDDPVRTLEKAGALIAAEIDRLLQERSGR